MVPERIGGHERVGRQSGDAVILPVCAGSAHLQAFWEIAAYAHERSPFYRRLYKQAEVRPEAGCALTVLPVVTAYDLATHATEFRTDAHIYRVAAGSGTTGKPKLLFRTPDDFAHSVENERTLLTWSGVGSSDTVAIAHAFDMWASGELIQRAAADLGATVVPVGATPDVDVHRILLETHATVLDTTPSRLRRLLALSTSVPPSQRPRIRVVMLSGEPVGAGIRSSARAIWGAEVYDQYGSEETDALAGNQAPGSKLFVLAKDFLFEVLDAVNDDRQGTIVGRLAITSLYHRGTPLVRYVLDDLVQLDVEVPDQIAILGRAGERFLLHDSVKLYPYQVQAALDLAGLGSVAWQCVLDREETRDHLTFRYVTNDGINSTATLGDLKSNLKRCTYGVEALIAMGDLEISIEQSVDMAEQSCRGKTPRFVDRRAPEGMII